MAFIAAAAPILGALGAGVSAVSTIAGGVANRDAANYRAVIAENNAVISRQSALYAQEAGAVKTEAAGRKGAAKLAGIRVGQAANGVNINTGSALDVQAGQRETDQLDAQTVQHEADLKAYGYRTQSDNFEADAKLEQSKADNAVAASVFKAGGGLLSAASSLGGKWGASGTSADRWTGRTEADELAAGERPV